MVRTFRLVGCDMQRNSYILPLLTTCICHAETQTLLTIPCDSSQSDFSSSAEDF